MGGVFWANGPETIRGVCGPCFGVLFGILVSLGSQCLSSWIVIGVNSICELGGSPNVGEVGVGGSLSV